MAYGDVLTLTAPFSPMRYETSPGSIHTDSSAGKFSKMSVMGTPLSRAARSNTASIGSPVFKHRNAEPYKNIHTKRERESEQVEQQKRMNVVWSIESNMRDENIKVESK